MLELDPVQLANFSLEEKQYWLYEVEAARQAGTRAMEMTEGVTNDWSDVMDDDALSQKLPKTTPIPNKEEEVAVSVPSPAPKSSSQHRHLCDQVEQASSLGLTRRFLKVSCLRRHGEACPNTPKRHRRRGSRAGRRRPLPARRRRTGLPLQEMSRRHGDPSPSLQETARRHGDPLLRPRPAQDGDCRLAGKHWRQTG